MLIANLKDKFPDYSTVSPPIGDLQAFYKVGIMVNTCSSVVHIMLMCVWYFSFRSPRLDLTPILTLRRGLMLLLLTYKEESLR